jgi:predicted alpha/beta hydrolase
MREIHTTLVTADGCLLAATVYEPIGRIHAAVQINSATGVPRRYYAAYARFLARNGFVVLSYDYRGIGDSRNHLPPVEPLRMHHWGSRDLATALQWLHQRHPQLPLLCVGHSVGGQLLGLAANNSLVTAALAIGAQSGYWRHWPRALQPIMAGLWHLLIPALVRFRGKLPAGLMGPELPGGIASEWARWCRNPYYISDELGAPIREHFFGYTGRMRFYAIGDDPFYAPLAAVQALAGDYRNADSELCSIQPRDYGLTRIGHFGFFRSSMPQRAWQETADWLRQAASVAPLALAA